MDAISARQQSMVGQFITRQIDACFHQVAA
ncbi:hypothetical protein L686_13380 [Stutzerimonas stutzeri MF28]|nr:hypothetical protein L686_13380 [Stutzerimonas stutzeri MF28]